MEWIPNSALGIAKKTGSRKGGRFFLGISKSIMKSYQAIRSELDIPPEFLRNMV